MLPLPDLADAQAALGRQLREARQAAGLTQQQFAAAVFTSRSSVACVETGRQNSDRNFWSRADQVTRAEGALLAAYDLLRDLRHRQRSAQAAAVVITGGGRDLPEFADAARSEGHLDEVVAYLRDQWHALVRADNLLGPRFALSAVLDNVSVIDALLAWVRGGRREQIVRLGAQYAESTSWLFEDCDDQNRARYWTGRAMEWAYEVGDHAMLAWTAYRRSCQAAAARQPAQTLGLATAARRDDQRLPAPMRAAIRAQQAYGHALCRDGDAVQRAFDDAYRWAAEDRDGDARGGHGSFCTPGYIDMRRADCMTLLGDATHAISIYERGLTALPPVYHRDRASGYSRLAVACLRAGELEYAATAARTALPAARDAGSKRIIKDVIAVATGLRPHTRLAPVTALLDDLAAGDG